MQLGSERVLRPQLPSTQVSVLPGSMKGVKTRQFRRPKAGRSFGDLRPALLLEWCALGNRGVDPFAIGPSVDYDAAWVCPCGHRWRAPVYSRARGAGCIKCRNRGIALRRATPKPGRSLGDLYPLIARDWHPALNGGLTPFDVSAHPRVSVVWLCHECGHQWSTQVSNRTRNNGAGTGCRDCWARNHSVHMSRVSDPADSIAGRYPDVATEWDFDAPENEGETPWTVMAHSGSVRGWKCVEGHRWAVHVFNRTANGNGCWECSRGRESKQCLAMREFLSARMPVADTCRVPRTDGRGKRPWLVDVLSVEAAVVVEFDGSYWHSERANPGMAVKDARKADDIRGQGFTVVRVRESPLVALHEHDLVVPLGLTGAEIGERVWAHLVTLGVGERLSRAS